MKLHWGWSIGIVYLVFVSGMILFAVKASQQKYDLVTDNYYEEAVRYQDRIDAGYNAINSSVKLSFVYKDDSKDLEIITDGKTKSVSGVLMFYKPDRAKDDFTMNFSTDNSGKQLLSLAKLSHGYWKVQAKWNTAGKECFEEKRIFIQ